MKRRTTLQDIAYAMGYSKNTISLALRNDPQIPELTRQRIRAKADEMGYRSNAVVSHLMAQLRASQTPRFQAKLALINANPDPKAFERHPTIPIYLEGCKRRAAQLGYDFDTFWLHDPMLTQKRLLNILKTRNIKGLILVGLMDTAALPEPYANTWDHFACVVTGVRTDRPTLSYCSVDHHTLTLQAVEKAIELGYRRPGLVIDDAIDRLVQRRFSAGYLIGQQELEQGDRIPPFLKSSDSATGLNAFSDWMARFKPDTVFTLYNQTIHWLEELGFSIPQDIGVMQLEWRPTQPDIAGMNQRNELTGEAAVDLVISQIHNDERGAPNIPRSTLISPEWRDGPSVRQQSAKAS
ncbi:MAG: LacI family transcriptional regulator [Opitutales bacterium TMED158]|nr:MAG: LacI family transcriptional regulator [Opitutales bacterium TMED158]